jgi:hypothetical protein
MCGKKAGSIDDTPPTYRTCRVRSENDIKAVVSRIHDAGDRHTSSGERGKEHDEAPPEVTSLIGYAEFSGEVDGEIEETAKS